MTKCPYCGHTINTTKELPELTPRQFKAFSLLLNNGREYTSVKALKEVLEVDSDTSVRVTIHYMKPLLAKKGMEIVSYKGVGYRLEEA